MAFTSDPQPKKAETRRTTRRSQSKTLQIESRPPLLQEYWQKSLPIVLEILNVLLSATGVLELSDETCAYSIKSSKLMLLTINELRKE